TPSTAVKSLKRLVSCRAAISGGRSAGIRRFYPCARNRRETPTITPAMPSSALPSVDRVRSLDADSRFPARFKPIVASFFSAYRAALADAGLNPDDYDHLLCGFVDQLEAQLDRPFTFEPYHQQILAPFDHYRYGVEFLRPLVDKA